MSLYGYLHELGCATAGGRAVAPAPQGARGWGRRAVALAALAGLLAGAGLLGGCARQGAEQAALNNTEVARIREELAGTQGVEQVDIRYQDTESAPGAATASIVLTAVPDDDAANQLLERVADVTVRSIWRSRIDPLETIDVSVVGDKYDGIPSIQRHYDVRQQGAVLERQYGPRPSKDG